VALVSVPDVAVFLTAFAGTVAIAAMVTV